MTEVAAPEAAANGTAHLTSGRARAAVTGVAWSLVHTVIPTLASGLVFFFGVAFLTPEDFGMIGLSLSLVMIGLALSPIAFAEALIQRSELTDLHINGVFWLSFLWGLAALVPFVVFADGIARIAQEPRIAALLPVLALRIPLDLAGAIPQALIIRSLRFRLIALRTAIASTLGSAICLVLLFQGFGVWALVASQVTTSAVLCLTAFWVTAWRPRVLFQLAALRELMRFGIFSTGDKMLAGLRLDHLLFGILGGVQSLGLYYFAQRVHELILQVVSGALSSVSYSLLSSLQNEKAKARKAFEMASFAAAAVGMPAFTLLGLTVDDLLALLANEAWARAALAVQVFCFLGVLATIGVVQAALVRSQGRPDWWFYYRLTQQIGTLLTILALFRFGGDAMMVGIALKTLLLWPISVGLAARVLGIAPLAYLRCFTAPFVATLAMGLAVLLVQPAHAGAAPLIALLLDGAVAGLTYLTVFALLAHGRVEDVLRIVRSQTRMPT